MTEKELLQQILKTVTNVDNRLLTVESDVSDLKTDVSGLKRDVSGLKETVNKNYNTVLEFYGSQKEHNTEVSDILDLISGKLEIYVEQTARNTIALKTLKRYK